RPSLSAVRLPPSARVAAPCMALLMDRSRCYFRAGHHTQDRTWRARGCPAGTGDTSCRSLPAVGAAKGRNRGPRLTARDSHGQEYRPTGGATRPRCLRPPHARASRTTGDRPSTPWGIRRELTSTLASLCGAAHIDPDTQAERMHENP